MSLFQRMPILPPSGDKWDFENPKHKKKLIEILAERDGFWCRFCGTPNALTIHHLRPRGQVSAEALIVDEKTSETFYRDDPRNLCFLCNFRDSNGQVSCHYWVHHYPLKAKEHNLLIEPKFHIKRND